MNMYYTLESVLMSTLICNLALGTRPGGDNGCSHVEIIEVIG